MLESTESIKKFINLYQQIADSSDDQDKRKNALEKIGKYQVLLKEQSNNTSKTKSKISTFTKGLLHFSSKVIKHRPENKNKKYHTLIDNTINLARDICKTSLFIIYIALFSLVAFVVYSNISLLDGIGTIRISYSLYAVIILIIIALTFIANVITNHMPSRHPHTPSKIGKLSHGLVIICCLFILYAALIPFVAYLLIE